MSKPVLHGRDHRPGGSDPIEGLGGGGITFEVNPTPGSSNEGEWLYIDTTGSPNPPFSNGIVIYEGGGYGIEINSYPDDDTPTGEADIEIIGTDGISLMTDSSTGGDGDILISANGAPAADINMIATGDFSFQATNSGGEMYIDIDDHIEIVSESADVEITAGGSFLYLYGDTDIYLDATGSGNLLIPGLPTSSPGGSGAVWNDSGTLKIT